MRGKLPGQAGTATLRFATAPRGLDTRDMADPGRPGIDGAAWWREPHERHYAVTDVFFAEVCVLATLCSNSWQLFTVRRGEDFTCEFEEKNWHVLASVLRGGGDT